jgi:N-methylhydantoinase B
MSATQDETRSLDPVLFTVLRHRLDEIIAEAYQTIGRVSGSPVVYESGDHQEAICTPTGELAVFGAGVLHWSMSLGAGIRHVIEQYSETPGFNEDDQFLLNDTYIATLHAPDVQLLAPVFYEGEILAWVGSSSHQTDVGGIDPGSLCVSAENVFQEGLLVPGIKIVERGELRRDVAELFRNVVRTPDLGLLDIRSKIASNNVMKRRLIELADRYGTDTVKTLFSELIDYSDRRVRARLREIPDGRWSSVDYIEGLKEPVLVGQVALVKKGDHLTFDLTGTSPQTAGSENIGPVGAKGSAVCPYIAMVCHDLPWNEGLFKSIDFVLPEGSLANPQRPAATSSNLPAGANVLIEAVSQNAVAKMLLCSEQYRHEASGNVNTSFELFVLAGQDRNGQLFTTLALELLAGGIGGSPEGDGAHSAANPWSVKAQIANVETNEMLYPFLYLWRREVIDSAGPGKHRGGAGLTVGIVPWETDSLINVNLGCGADQRNTLGLSGGYPAGNTPARIRRNANVAELWARGARADSPEALEGEDEVVPVKSVVTVGANDVLYGVVSSGGGGFGDPIERDPQLVLADVRAGYVSAAAAKEAYGVVVSDDGDAVDEERTAARRREIVADRLANWKANR